MLPTIAPSVAPLPGTGQISVGTPAQVIGPSTNQGRRVLLLLSTGKRLSVFQQFVRGVAERVALSLK